MVEENRNAVKMMNGAAGQHQVPDTAGAPVSGKVYDTKKQQKEASIEDDNYRYYLEFCRLEYSRQVLLHQLNIALQEQDAVQTRLQKISVSPLFLLFIRQRMRLLELTVCLRSSSKDEFLKAILWSYFCHSSFKYQIEINFHI